MENFLFDQDLENLISKKIECSDSQELNEILESEKLLVLYVNVRSLNVNFSKLELFIESLKTKPSDVCAKSWLIESVEFFQLPGYKIYYNESKINKSDGVVVYIKNNITQDTKTITIDRLNFLATDININEKETLRISAIYRSHNISKTEFVRSIKRYLQENINIKNHCIIGDFNINILYTNTHTYDNSIGQEFLNNFFVFEYLPYFMGITRPAREGQGGTCIDNFL